MGVSEFPFLAEKATIDFLKISHTMFIMRGVPGSGKSTLAKRIHKQYPDAVLCSADDFFVDTDGIYKYVDYGQVIGYLYSFRGYNSASFLFAILLNGNQILKERICSSRSKFFPLRVDSLLEGLHPPALSRHCDGMTN